MRRSDDSSASSYSGGGGGGSYNDNDMSLGDDDVTSTVASRYLDCTDTETHSLGCLHGGVCLAQISHTGQRLTFCK